MNNDSLFFRSPHITSLPKKLHIFLDSSSICQLICLEYVLFKSDLKKNTLLERIILRSNDLGSPKCTLNAMVCKIC